MANRKFRYFHGIHLINSHFMAIISFMNEFTSIFVQFHIYKHYLFLLRPGHSTDCDGSALFSVHPKQNFSGNILCICTQFSPSPSVESR